MSEYFLLYFKEKNPPLYPNLGEKGVVNLLSRALSRFWEQEGVRQREKKHPLFLYTGIFLSCLKENFYGGKGHDMAHMVMNLQNEVSCKEEGTAFSSHDDLTSDISRESNQ